MLKRITIENFFSFGERTAIELNKDINVLVGINGSGKSNFLKALELLHEGVMGDGLHNLLIKKWGGIDNIKHSGERGVVSIKLIYEFSFNLFNFKYTIIIHTEGHVKYLFDEYLEVNNHKEEEWQKLIDVTGGVGFSFAGTYISENPDFNYKLDEHSSHSLDSKELLLGQIRINYNRADLLYSFIQNLNFYKGFDTNFDSPLRQPNILGQGITLSKNGENLNSVIQNLQNNHTLEYEKIEEKLKDINPNFKGVTFNFFASKVYLSLRENGLSKVVPVEHISDGTLNYLALLAIFYNPKRGSLVCFDEPETGLHPDMINTIAKAIKEASKGTQLFIATHSPLLLNSFDIEDLLIFEKDANNQTQVLTKTEEDFEDWNDDFSLGQLWLNGQIGGKRW